MCGIAGIVGSPVSARLDDVAVAMADSMFRRGPDSSGVWIDSTQCIALAHRRLAILDLSPAGHQPMVSRDARYVISFNGEIYNHLELRAELERTASIRIWHSTSDTETLIEAFAAWGVRNTLRRVRGMFAFALWDARDQVLTLARDPLGEKPLYYGHVGGLFVFGSEIKAIRAVPGWCGEIDLDALDFYTRYSYVPAPASIFRGLRKLEAGSLVEVRSWGKSVSVPEHFAGVRARPLDELVWVALSDEEAAWELESRVARSVRERMISDVPLGALFSGGIDSTTVVALMQRTSAQPVKTFTVGFGEHEFNEAKHARRLATFLGTDHHEIYVRPCDALDVIPGLPGIWDEPFADPSQVPSYLVARFARQHVTVALAGDGGDELFCGYRHYALAESMHRRLRLAPAPLRHAVAALLSAAATLRLRRGAAGAQWAERLARLGHTFGYRTLDQFCESLLAVYQDASLVPGASGRVESQVELDPARLQQGMMELDLLRYLPENIMTKSDRASMGVGLELRAPFLDPDLVDFARAMPLDLKYRNGQSKWLLRQVLYRLVPQDLVDRPKAGFSVPIAQWLRGELSGWAEELLSVANLERSGVYDVKAVRRLWKEHRGQRRLRQRVLWNVLMFQAWWIEWDHHRPAPRRLSGVGS
jgi:asparagine synthase (glutamine-hydrolysing)